MEPRSAREAAGRVQQDGTVLFWHKLPERWWCEAEDMTDDETPERYGSDGFRWIAEQCGDWFFAIPLGAFKDENDVKRIVVEPVHRLIAGDDSQDALGPIKDDLCLPPEHQELRAEAS